MISEIAKRYADATFSLFEENELLGMQSTCKELIKMLKENNDVVELFDNRFIEKAERISLVDKTFVDLDIRLKNLIKVVIDNNRVKFLLEIFDAINSLINQHYNVLEGIVYSAFKLSDEEIQKVELKISEVEQQKCSLKNVIDSSLIGGIKVAISSHVYDNSIKNKIEKMKIDLA